MSWLFARVDKQSVYFWWCCYIYQCLILDCQVDIVIIVNTVVLVDIVLMMRSVAIVVLMPGFLILIASLSLLVHGPHTE